MSSKSKHEVLLGKYEMGRLLGRGTFAKVYYARSIADGSAVAVKVLDKPEIAKMGVGPLIIREVSAMCRLSYHPNILRLYEVMATKSKIYLVMEYAAAGELFARLSRCGRLPEPAARRYFHQLISALRFSHAHGIAHRDVKPENLLLDRQGNLKLSDFGLSALPDQLRHDGRLHTTCGTPAYTAPEVIRRKGYDGPKADAWSCGVILYFLLTGFLPFDDSNLALMYTKIHKRDYKFPPWFSPLAKRAVSRLLDPNPESRITLDGVMELPWIKRGASERDGEFKKEFPATFSALSMNAFDIISLSKGLDLSRLFDDDGGNRRMRRFTSRASVEKVMEKVEEVGGRLGYEIERSTTKGGGVGVVGRGRLGVSRLFVEVSEVVAQVLLVEVVVVDVGGGRGGGDGKGEGGVCWGSLRKELGDIVFDWQEIEDSRE